MEYVSFPCYARSRVTRIDATEDPLIFHIFLLIRVRLLLFYS
jgi:hypothetical protein